MIHNYCAQLGDILIRPLHLYDIENLREWRNNETLSKYLRNVGNIDEEAQRKWYERYLTDNNIVFFAVSYKRRTVGALALYNFEIEKKKCEIGKIVIGEKETRGHHVAEMAFFMAMGIGNACMKIDHFHLSVHEDNLPAKRVYEKLGFEKTGAHPFERGGEEWEMAVDSARVRANSAATQVFLFDENGSTIQKWI